MTRRLHRVALALAGLCLATLSCQVILGLEEPVGVAGDVDARTDVTSDAAPEATGPTRCEQEGIPGPPADAPVLPKSSYWLVATRAMTSDGAPDAGVVTGFNLDESCTCQRPDSAGEPSCRAPVVDTECDLAGGVDDALGGLVRQADTTLGAPLLDAVNEDFHEGRRALLLYLGDYNGTANDADVQVQLVISGGLYEDIGCDGGARDAAVSPPTKLELSVDAALPATRYKPLYDGCDRFSPNKELTTAAGGTRVPKTTVHGYVTDNVVVVEIDSFSAPLFGASVSLVNAVGVARLSKGADGRLGATVFIGGRLSAEDLLSTVGRVGQDGKPLCEDAFAWSVIRAALCERRDIRGAKVEDFNDLPCDALSGTIGFEFEESLISTTIEYTRPILDENTCAETTCDD